METTTQLYVVLSTENGVLCGGESFEIRSCFLDLAQCSHWGKSFLAQEVNYDTSKYFIDLQSDACDQPCDVADTLCGYKVIFTLLPLLGPALKLAV